MENMNNDKKNFINFNKLMNYDEFLSFFEFITTTHENYSSAMNEIKIDGVYQSAKDLINQTAMLDFSNMPDEFEMKKIEVEATNKEEFLEIKKKIEDGTFEPTGDVKIYTKVEMMEMLDSAKKFIYDIENKFQMIETAKSLIRKFETLKEFYNKDNW
jgi:hypothetical protein